MSWVAILKDMTEREGRCTKCGSLAVNDWAGCPLDGYCPAPDYTRRDRAARATGPASPQGAEPKAQHRERQNPVSAHPKEGE